MAATVPAAPALIPAAPAAPAVPGAPAPVVFVVVLGARAGAPLPAALAVCPATALTGLVVLVTAAGGCEAVISGNGSAGALQATYKVNDTAQTRDKRMKTRLRVNGDDAAAHPYLDATSHIASRKAASFYESFARQTNSPSARPARSTVFVAGLSFVSRLGASVDIAPVSASTEPAMCIRVPDAALREHRASDVYPLSVRCIRVESLMAAKVNTQSGGRALGVWQMLMLLACFGCNTLLGNERVQSNAASSVQRDSGLERAEAQDGGVAKRADAPDVAGRNERGGTAGRAPAQDSPAAGDKADPSADAPDATVRGAAGSAAADSGDAGSPREPQPDAMAIRGTVVDSYRRPVPGAWVWIDAQSVQTDENGQFGFDSATSVYDLTLTVSHTNASGAPLREAWRYEGITRRDPTIQCLSGFGYRNANIQLHVALDGFPQPAGPYLVAAFGSRDYGMGWWVDRADFVPPTLSWFGPDLETTGNLHALLYQTDNTGIPIGYHAHTALPAQLGNTTTDVTLSFPAGQIPSIRLSGQVSGPHERARNDLLVQHFADGTELTVPLSIQSLDTFSYLAPRLPDSSTTVVMREGSLSPPYAAAVIEGVTSDRGDLSLEIPRTPQLTAPGDGKSGVDETTAFSWTLSEPRVAMLVAYGSSLADILYVVTANTEAQLPTGAAFGYTVPAATSFTWYVYTRDATSIDDVTADASHTLLADHWTTGHYAASVPRTFVTAE